MHFLKNLALKYIKLSMSSLLEVYLAAASLILSSLVKLSSEYPSSLIMSFSCFKHSESSSDCGGNPLLTMESFNSARWVGSQANNVSLKATLYIFFALLCLIGTLAQSVIWKPSPKTEENLFLIDVGCGGLLSFECCNGSFPSCALSATSRTCQRYSISKLWRPLAIMSASASMVMEAFCRVEGTVAWI